MDSLTQIVLGAAVGEAVLGRKAGNRAMLWGGICGTLPDLDVFANAVSDPMSALAYHRAFTHSLPFALLAAPLVGLALHRFYGGREGPVKGWLVWPVLLTVFYLLLTGGSYLMPIEVYNIPKITLAITAAFAAFFVVIGGLRWLRGFPAKVENAGWRGWTMLAFGAIVTHPLLDCFTAYGTQLFQPLADSRVAWNTISVADPIYTIPFLILLVWARTRVQGSEWRARLNKAGLILSSVYLALTVVNYFNVDSVMDATLEEEGIVAERTVVSPSILNNVLWSGTAKDAQKDLYYFSQYSLFDAERRFQPFTEIAGNHHWLGKVDVVLWAGDPVSVVAFNSSAEPCVAWLVGRVDCMNPKPLCGRTELRKARAASETTPLPSAQPPARSCSPLRRGSAGPPAR